MKYTRLVLVNLVRNRRRTLLTTLAIAISLLAFAVLTSLPAIAASILRDRAGSLRLFGHSKAGMLYSLPQAYRRRLETIKREQRRRSSPLALAEPSEGDRKNPMSGCSQNPRYVTPYNPAPSGSASVRARKWDQV